MTKEQKQGAWPDWQPIATAPKNEAILAAIGPYEDGTWRVTRMMWRENATHALGYFHELGIEEMFGIGHVTKFQPSHWMPLPEPPACGGQQ